MTRFQQNLSAICNELGLAIYFDHVLTFPSGNRITCTAFIPELGGPLGMIIAMSVDQIRPVAKEIESTRSYGCTVLSDYRDGKDYDKQGCIEMFSEWGWSGPHDTKPSWMLGQ